MTPTQPPGLRADEQELPPLPAPVTHTDLHGFLHTEQQMQEYALQARAALTPQPAEPSDAELDSSTAAERDELLDFIYEHGTASEGVLRLIRKVQRAALAQHGAGKAGK